MFPIRSVAAAAGADLLCIETMTDLAEALLAVRASKRVAPGVPVVATRIFEPTAAARTAGTGSRRW